MKRLALFAAAAAIALATAWWLTRDAPPERDSIEIVTWNLQWFPGKKPGASQVEARTHISEVGQALREIDADVLCLQEIRSWHAVEAVLPLKLHVASDFETYGGNSQQVAIASDREAISVFAELFTEREDVDPPRGFACAALDAGNGRMLLCYTLHLKSNLGDLEANIAKREESIRQLLQHVEDTEPLFRDQGWGHIVLIVAGDLNTDSTDRQFRNEKTFQLLEEFGLETDLVKKPLSERVTSPADGRYPDASFDWILVRPIEGMRYETRVEEPGDHISDHRPVVMEIWWE